MKTGSHIEVDASATLRLLPDIGVVDLADPGVAERLAPTIDAQLEVFAATMREGLLAASVAIGLGVMGELIDAEVTDLARPQRPPRPRAAGIPSRHRGRPGHPGRAPDPGASTQGPHCR